MFCYYNYIYYTTTNIYFCRKKIIKVKWRKKVVPYMINCTIHKLQERIFVNKKICFVSSGTLTEMLHFFFLVSDILCWRTTSTEENITRVATKCPNIFWKHRILTILTYLLFNVLTFAPLEKKNTSTRIPA